ncbi:MAG: GC-type dockerin domain-anchored protein, partial [Phycisphaerales bacterium]
TPGVTYLGSFDLSGNLHNQPVIKTMTLTVMGEGLLLEEDYAFDTTGATRTDMNYETHEFSFVADHTSATITFQSTTSPAGWGPALDNIVIMPVGVDPPCVADCDKNGSLNILDFVCFQGLFSSGDMRANVNGDCQLNILDFVAFQQFFVAGCP